MAHRGSINAEIIEGLAHINLRSLFNIADALRKGLSRHIEPMHSKPPQSL